MTSLRVKYAMLLLDEMVATGGSPWERLAMQAASRRGPASMQVPLVPGFDATYSDLLGESHDGDVDKVNEDRREAKGGKRLFSMLAKRGEALTLEYAPGEMHRFPDIMTGPGAGRDYSALSALETRSNVDQGWLRADPGGFDRVAPDLNEQVGEAPTAKAASMLRQTGTPDSGESDVDREIATQMAQVAERDPLTPEEVIKAAVLQTMSPALDFSDPTTVVEGERDPGWVNPARTTATDKTVRSTTSVWDEHEAFELSPDTHAIVDHTPYPGPVP